MPEDNSMKEYVDNFRANLPEGVTYGISGEGELLKEDGAYILLESGTRVELESVDIARYFCNGRRFLNEWEVERYLNYIKKFGFSVSP